MNRPVNFEISPAKRGDFMPQFPYYAVAHVKRVSKIGIMSRGTEYNHYDDESVQAIMNLNQYPNNRHVTLSLPPSFSSHKALWKLWGIFYKIKWDIAIEADTVLIRTLPCGCKVMKHTTNRGFFDYEFYLVGHESKVVKLKEIRDGQTLSDFTIASLVHKEVNPHGLER